MRIPTRDLCADLRNGRDEALGDTENVCTATNRQLRLYVCAWMLTERDSPIGFAHGIQRALTLYEGCGKALLEAPGPITTSSIVTEVLRMSAKEERPS